MKKTLLLISIFPVIAKANTIGKIEPGFWLFYLGVPFAINYIAVLAVYAIYRAVQKSPQELYSWKRFGWHLAFSTILLLVEITILALLSIR